MFVVAGLGRGGRSLGEMDGDGEPRQVVVCQWRLPCGLGEDLVTGN